jgi:hypothetical protein
MGRKKIGRKGHRRVEDVLKEQFADEPRHVD